nr:hypothetical protein CFP56_32378 [Quercus suber]
MTFIGSMPGITGNTAASVPRFGFSEGAMPGSCEAEVVCDGEGSSDTEVEETESELATGDGTRNATVRVT